MIAEAPLLLPYPEVARLLGVSDRTVWGMVNRGELPGIRVGRRSVRVDRRDVESFIASAKSSAAPGAASGSDS